MLAIKLLTQLDSTRLNFPYIGIESIFFRILKTLYRPCFFIVLMSTGVKTKVLDKIWQKNHFLTVYHGWKLGAKFRAVFEPTFLAFFSSPTTINQSYGQFFVLGWKPCKNASIQAQPEVASSIRWGDIPKWRQMCQGLISAILGCCLVSCITSKRIEL